MRIYVAGPIAVEVGNVVLRECDLPGVQGRVVLTMLAVERGRLVTSDELADELWPDALPRSWKVSLRSIVSRVRGSLASHGAGSIVTSAAGCYRLRLPTGGWLDVEAARDALHEAETQLGSGDARAAVVNARVAGLIASRPFLPGVYSPWTVQQRDRLTVLRVDANECLARALAASGDFAGSARVAGRALLVDPYREALHRLLIRSRALAGDRAGAAKAFADIRDLLAREFGVEPTEATLAVYREAVAGRALSA